VDAAPRRADAQDLEALTETLWLAFAEDPLWRWAFRNHAQLRPLWRMYVASALKHDWVWTVGDFAAVSVWIPPGRSELTPEEESRLPGLMQELLGARAAEVMKLFDAFDAAHPHSPPHYYLTLLGTHPNRQGQGTGMALLAANLDLIDAEQAPAYLESSNPANESRYESVGFRPNGAFKTPDASHEISTMWREQHAEASSPGKP
jgi:GNAT superfamily N-acetyltransferase